MLVRPETSGVLLCEFFSIIQIRQLRIFLVVPRGPQFDEMCIDPVVAYVHMPQDSVVPVPLKPIHDDKSPFNELRQQRRRAFPELLSVFWRVDTMEPNVAERAVAGSNCDRVAVLDLFDESEQREFESR